MDTVKGSVLVGEVRCVNCGRELAEVVRDAGRGCLALRPARHQSSITVEVLGGRMLQCGRCHGRAFIEPVEFETAEAGATRSVRLLRGAA